MKTWMVLGVYICILLPVPSRATQFRVNYCDNDGPEWTGLVDTIADSITITNWHENAGALNFWEPAMPLTLIATASDKTRFDVPDNWDGVIGENWGFISPLSVYHVPWKNGMPDVIFKNYSMGWGGSIQYGRFWKSQWDMENGGRFYVVQTSPDGGQSSVADSISVYEIPEPATLLLLGLGGLAMRRRM